MNFDVYCDESGPELLHSEKPKARFMVIGSLWLPESLRVKGKAAIHELRHRHGIGSEFKWRKVSPSKLAFYRDLVDWFQGAGPDLRFRAIVVDRTKKTYDKTRRVTLVCGNYVVVIAITGPARANFVTAYVADTPRTLAKLKTSPKWTP